MYVRGDDAWISCALYCYCTIKGRCRRERGERRGEPEEQKGKEVDTVELARHRDNPNPYSVTGRKAEGCMVMACASIIMRRTGEQ